MSINYTPGPWHVFSHRTRNGTDIWKEAEITYGLNKHGDGPEGPVCEVKSPNVETDAQLIAAAPDLYEALDTLINYGHSANWHEAFQPLIRKARYALAKARGDASEGRQ